MSYISEREEREGFGEQRRERVRRDSAVIVTVYQNPINPVDNPKPHL
jgi:hypothetical protein